MMFRDIVGSGFSCAPLDRKEIQSRLESCPSLPSLRSINHALRGLLASDQRFTFQIAEIIRRDPSLTARILRLVNSVYYGLSRPIKNIEEAVFYLGVRQIRELAMVTPIIEDLQKLTGNRSFPWRDFWRHCIGTAIMTREITESIRPSNDDTNYLGALLHDVGKIVMAATFPEHFTLIYQQKDDAAPDLLQLERTILGLDHAELGALYLKNQALPEMFVEIAQFHHEPGQATHSQEVVSAVQVANLMIRQAKIGSNGEVETVSPENWFDSAGWKILFSRKTDAEQSILRASLKRNLDRIPVILEGLV